MSKLYKFAVIFSFFALWITVYFSKTYQQIAGFVVIFLFGILHGANDLALYAKIDSRTTNKSFKKIVFYYVLIIIFGILLFYCVPTLALLLFIIFSGYHFGEQHWNYLKKSGSQISTSIFQTIYGLFIFSMLFYFHESEVELIVSKIIHYSISDINFTGITIALGIGLMLSSIDMYRKFLKFKNQILINIFYLMVFAIIFKTADLIWAFAIYFVVWHSIPSIKEQINYLYGNFTIPNFIIYFKSAFIYWMLSLIGISIIYYVFKDNELFNAVFFSFLAAITFPHTLIIVKMQHDK